MFLRNRDFHYVIAALLITSILKYGLVSGGYIPFNSDEAVVGLMARHILQGERPIFFYGQAYMGSLDAWLVAGGFALFGQKVWVIRLVQGILYLGVIFSTYLLGKKIFNSSKVGILAAWLLAIPTLGVTLYTTISLGGYGEALLIGNLIIISTIRIKNSLEVGAKTVFWEMLGWGFLAGLGLWVFGITLVYTIPAFIYLLVGFRRLEDGLRKYSEKTSEIFVKLLVFASLGFVVGAAPWIIYAYNNGFGVLIWELVGGNFAGVENISWLDQIWQHTVNFLLLGSSVILGLRPPWEVRWLALPLAPFALTFWLMVISYIGFSLRKGRSWHDSFTILVGMILTLLVVFIISPFGADPSGRYFVPIAIPLALFGGALVEKLESRLGSWAYGAIALVLCFNLWGTIGSALRFPPGLTTHFDAMLEIDHRYDQQLISFLKNQGETKGYTNYWVSYPIAFLSEEELIFTPRLPYHQDLRYTPKDNRYPAYDSLVDSSDTLAYITTKNSELDAFLRQRFNELNIDWKENVIGSYSIFYDLSRRVDWETIGLGVPDP